MRYGRVDRGAPVPLRVQRLLEVQQEREFPWRIPDAELREMTLRLAALVGPVRALGVMADVLESRRSNGDDR